MPQKQKWWRRRESNPRPKRPKQEHLRVYSAVKSQWRNAQLTKLYDIQPIKFRFLSLGQGLVASSSSSTKRIDKRDSSR